MPSLLIAKYGDIGSMSLYGFISSSETLLSSAWKYFVESEGIKILFFLLHPVSIGLKAMKPNLDSSLISLTPMYVLPTSVFGLLTDE